MITNNHLWGESWTIYRDKQVWVVGFRGRKGGASSLHYHEHMAQSFCVLYGELHIRHTEGCEGSHLFDGWIFSLGSNHKHQLEFWEDTEGIETYYALPGHEIDPNDIVRLSPGRAPDAAPA
jgi:quercetin dioxygenase-like cupin family protein